MIGVESRMEKVLVNDQVIPRSDARVDIEDRGYQFGDGVYEVIRVYNGKMFTAEEHLDRLFSSAEKIFIAMPYTKAQIKQWVEQLIVDNRIINGSVYMQITRGANQRNHVFPDETVQPVLTAYTREVPRPTQAMRDGVKTIIHDDIRWLRCDIKSLNLLPNLMAKQAAKEQGSYEAILHRDGTVTEGSSSNIFIIKDGVIKTHPATNLILNGITRQQLFTICKEENMICEEAIFTLDELKTADEVFLTSTTSEVMPIVQIDQTLVADGKPGKITKQLQQLLTEKF